MDDKLFKFFAVDTKKRIVFLLFIPILLCLLCVCILCFVTFQPRKPSTGNIPVHTVTEFTHPTSNIVQVIDDNDEKYILTKNTIEKYDVSKELVWKYDNIKYWMGVENIVADDRYIYFDNSETTTALDKQTGKVVWEEKHYNGGITSTEIIGSYKNFIFLEIYNYGLYTINKDNGKTLWFLNYSRNYAELSFFQDKVIIFLRDKVVICDLFTGKQIDILEFDLAYTLIQKNSTLYFGERIGSSSWRLESYDLNSHMEHILFNTDERMLCLSIKNNNLFLATENDIYKINLSGEKVWKKKFGGNECISMLVSDKLILLRDAYNHVYGINPETGDSYGYIENYHVKEHLENNAFIDDHEKINIFLLFGHGYIQLIENVDFGNVRSHMTSP
jgi:outer membrane protein assembly factor BamB